MAANSEKVKRKLIKKLKSKIENQPFYDSDEEIGWGKLTLKEVKARLNKPQQLKVEARARYSTPCLKQKTFENQKEMEQINKDDSIPAISEYLTASEEGHGIENSVCTSNYLSVMEPNVTKSDKSSIYLSTIDIEKSKNNFVDDTCLNFVQKALDATEDDIANEYQSLIDPTFNCSNESTSSSISTSKNDLLILISSDEDDEDELEPQENLSFEIHREPLSCVKEECEEQSSSFSEKEYTAEDTYNSDEEYRRSIQNLSIDRGTSRGDSMYYSRNLSSPISIPEIDLHQFNDSTASVLNNTLDKINAILAENTSLNESSEVEDAILAENTSLNENSEVEDAIVAENILNENSEVEEVEITENKNSSILPEKKAFSLISASFLQTPVSHTFRTEENYLSPEKKYNTPFKTPKTYKLSPKNTPIINRTHIPVFKKSPDFRVPDLPNKHKLATPQSKDNFKDIISPVRMYIKYSPKPILKQTVHHATEKPHTKLNPSPILSEAGKKINHLEIPNVVYKPSKKQIFALNETTNFPKSLDKMIKKSSVIKHERHPLRPNVNEYKTLDHEADLTKSFQSDCSNLSEIENVSILHKKTALKN